VLKFQKFVPHREMFLIEENLLAESAAAIKNPPRWAPSKAYAQPPIVAPAGESWRGFS
jgi:hypothetical protein